MTNIVSKSDSVYACMYIYRDRQTNRENNSLQINFLESNLPVTELRFPLSAFPGLCNVSIGRGSSCNYKLFQVFFHGKEIEKHCSED
jgi:hypothetical protein